MNASWNGLAPNPLLSAGRILATTSEDNTVRLWDVAARKELRTLRGHTDAVYGASWSPDGASLLSAGSDGNIVLWDPHAGVKKSVHLPTTHNPPRLNTRHLQGWNFQTLYQVASSGGGAILCFPHSSPDQYTRLRVSGRNHTLNVCKRSTSDPRANKSSLQVFQQSAPHFLFLNLESGAEPRGRRICCHFCR